MRRLLGACSSLGWSELEGDVILYGFEPGPGTAVICFPTRSTRDANSPQYRTAGLYRDAAAQGNDTPEMPQTGIRGVYRRPSQAQRVLTE